jgi:predicted regulator of Ras-like GTPase activity (Roadblock/LC7/MglB family)
MEPIIVDRLNEELRKLEFTGGIIGTAIVEKNGLLITSRLPRDIDERKFGAMAATIHGAFETALTHIEGENINHITIELEGYELIVMGLDKLILISLLEINKNLAIALIEMEQTLNKFKTIINN